jgi:hypothetical protein
VGSLSDARNYPGWYHFLGFLLGLYHLADLLTGVENSLPSLFDLPRFISQYLRR